MIAKNEGPYLIEWVAYYVLLGFDQIVVYDNLSTDGSSETLKKLAEAGVINYRIWKKGAKESPQITAYADALRRAKTEWILFVDADEYLVLPDHRTVAEFLAPFHTQHHITTIAMNWRLFGDSGLTAQDDRLVTERFYLAAEPDFPIQRHLKSFARVKAVKKPINMHICGSKGLAVYSSGEALVMSEVWGVSEKINRTAAWVNHYYTKTYAEYQVKKARGQAGCGANDAVKYTYYHDAAFHAHNRNSEPDRTIQVRLDELKEGVRRLQAIVDR